MRVRTVVGGALALAFVVVGYLVGHAAGQQRAATSGVRLPALAEHELNDAHRALLGDYAKGGRTLYLFRVCARTPELCRAWIPASRYFGTSPLALRERELLILRTCWLTKNEYTWGNHVAAAKRAGLTDGDIARITKGPAAGWNADDGALLRAVDELHAAQVISEATWRALKSRYGDRELSDLIFIVGQYTFVAMYAKSGGFPMEPGAPGFPTP